MPSQRHLLLVACALTVLAMSLVVATTRASSQAEPELVTSQAAFEPWTFPPPPTTAPPTTTTTAPPPPPTTEPRPVTTTTVAPRPVSTTPAPAPVAGSCAGWEDTIAAHFPAEQVAKACRVMMCESGGNPTAQNSRSTASGLFQFLDSTWESTTGTPAPASAYSGDAQTAAAASLWRSSGWSPWMCA